MVNTHRKHILYQFPLMISHQHGCNNYDTTRYQSTSGRITAAHKPIV